MRRYYYLPLFAVAIIFYALAALVPVPVQAVSRPPAVSARAYVVMDLDSGRILASKNSHLRLSPASLTKIMTALVALEEASLNDVVSVSSRAAGTGGSQLGVRTGEKLPMWKMLYGMIFRSGNDAAVAVAENVAGSETAFVKLMNIKAPKLGLKDTHFANPHGLSASSHYSTAYDIAVITREAMRNRVFRDIVGQKKRELYWGDKSRILTNINNFLGSYTGATGVKTGYTSRAGYCLSATSERGGRRLLVVLLHEPSSWTRWRDAANLMDWGYTSFDASLKEPSRESKLYTVRKGDTLSEIAQKFGISVDDLKNANGLRSSMIRVGDELVIPVMP